jgi:predicted nucleic acid-binding protein
MLKLLVDTNVILDVILERGQHGVDGALLLSAIQSGEADGYIAGHSITTTYYIVARAANDATARLAVTYLLQILSVVPLGADDFHTAIALGISDFEDAVQIAAALAVQADYVVTGNKKDFKQSPVTVRSAAELLPLLASSTQ